MLKVLYVASEAVPFVKTGGLADVAGSLPKALKKQGVDIRVVIPKYGKIDREYLDKMEHVYDGELRNISIVTASTATATTRSGSRSLPARCWRFRSRRIFGPT